jgi:hypothetical protein
MSNPTRATRPGQQQSLVGFLKGRKRAKIVHDAKQLADFYAKVLGFRISDSVEDFFVFMRCGRSTS